MHNDARSHQGWIYGTTESYFVQDKNNNPGDLINVFTSAMAEYTKLMNILLFSKSQLALI